MSSHRGGLELVPPCTQQGRGAEGQRRGLRATDGLGARGWHNGCSPDVCSFFPGVCLSAMCFFIEIYFFFFFFSVEIQSYPWKITLGENGRFGSKRRRLVSFTTSISSPLPALRLMLLKKEISKCLSYQDGTGVVSCWGCRDITLTLTLLLSECSLVPLPQLQ